MLKTERMKQVVVAGAKPQLVPVIETLQRLRVLHIEEHRPDDFFTYGDPLPEGERVAEARLKARGLIKSLQLEGVKRTGKAPTPDWQQAITTVEETEDAITGLVRERESVRNRLREHEQEAERLRRLAGLGLRLEQLRGYRNLSVFLGTTTSDPEEDLKTSLKDHLLLKTPEDSQYLIALYCRQRDHSTAENLLAQDGFSAIEPPAGHGPVDSAAGRAITEARRLKNDLDDLEARLKAARDQHGEPLLAAEDALAAAAERANAPLRFASSAHGFVVTGFVPASRVEATESALQQATSQSLYIEWSEPVTPRHGHHDTTPAEESSKPHGHSHQEAVEPPSRFQHKRRGPAAFTHMLTLHSYPKYKEIDPTVLMYITFPLFFAVMIGDMAFGFLIMLVALYLRNNYPLGMGGPKVSRMLMLAGFWTFIFGIFVYQEAFGMHFVQSPGTMSWEAILATLGAWGTYQSAASSMDLATVTYTIGGYTFETHYLSKLGNVELLLGISLALALLHLVLAICIGVYNMWILHGAKHAILGRFSWLLMIAGIIALAAGIMQEATNLQYAGWGLLGLSVVMIIAGEGVIGALELPKILSNALSYFRLAAVAMGKAGMALAANTLGFVAVTDTSFAVAGIAGWIILILGHTIVLALGIIAGGLHSMRLQLVEFFNWFYEGGGRPFKPFGDPTHRQ
jgi:V/A-type H+/Na+-transporting ATPase subunit I